MIKFPDITITSKLNLLIRKIPVQFAIAIVVIQLATLFTASPACHEKNFEINSTKTIVNIFPMSNIPSPVEGEDREIFDFEDMIIGETQFIFSPKVLLHIFDFSSSNLYTIPISIFTPPPQIRFFNPYKFN